MTDAELSKLLFEARESIDMYADVVDARTGRKAPYLRDLVTRLDAYRAERGWSPNGFGGECSTCGGEGKIPCAAHMAGDGCDEMMLTCPDCQPGSPPVDEPPPVRVEAGSEAQEGAGSVEHDATYRRLGAELRKRRAVWEGDAVLAAVRQIDRLRADLVRVTQERDDARRSLKVVSSLHADSGLVIGLARDQHRAEAERDVLQATLDAAVSERDEARSALAALRGLIEGHERKLAEQLGYPARHPGLAAMVMQAGDLRREVLHLREAFAELDEEHDATNVDHGRDVESWRRDAEALAALRTEVGKIADEYGREAAQARRRHDATTAATSAARWHLGGAAQVWRDASARLRALVTDQSPAAPGTATCVHCGRTCGDYAGGIASVNDDPLCHPNAPDRPDCYSSVTVQRHQLRGCWTCAPRQSPTSDTQTSETAEQLHARLAHPGWEYETTTGQRKAFDGYPPPGEGWERNVDYHDGWERFDYHEEAYWRRPATSDTQTGGSGT